MEGTVKEKQVKTDNELIAEFMGAVRSQDYGVCDWKTYWINNNDPQPTDVRDMKYHTSWDWLMPVVEKINEVCKDTGYPDDMEICHFHICAVASNIKLVHAACVIFIEWYNSENQKVV